MSHPFKEGGLWIHAYSSQSSDSHVIYTGINVNQIISPQGCCFPFQDSEDIKIQSLEKVSN